MITNIDQNAFNGFSYPSVGVGVGVGAGVSAG